jgi:hypothetical protein
LRKNHEIKRKLESNPKFTQEHLEELKGYMLNFMSDVENNRDIKIYEGLKNGYIPPDFREWQRYEIKSALIKAHVQEAFWVLFLENKDIPLCMNFVHGDLAKLIVERRLKGELSQLI